MNTNKDKLQPPPIIRKDSEDFAKDVEYVLARERGSFGRRNPPRELPHSEGEKVHTRIWNKLSAKEILPEQIRRRMGVAEQIRTETAIIDQPPLGETPDSLQIKQAYASTYIGDVPDYTPHLHHVQQSGPNCLIFSTVMATEGKAKPIDILTCAIHLYPNVVRTLGTVKPVIESLALEGIRVEEKDLLPYTLSISAFCEHIDQGKIVFVAIETPLKLWGILPSKTEEQDSIVGHAVVIDGYGYSSKNELLFFLQDPFLPDGPTPILAQSLMSHLKNKYLVFSASYI